MLPRAAKQSLAVSPAHSFDSTTLTEAEIRALVARFGSPLLVVDCEQVRRQYRALQATHCRASTFTTRSSRCRTPRSSRACATKVLIFDLATTGEVELVKAQGIAPSRCIHTHPIKRDSDIRDALRYGVTTFVADNPDELRKFVRYRKRAELLLRVSFPQPDGRLRPVEEIRLRAGRCARPDRNGAPPRRARARPVVPCRLASDRSCQVRRSGAGVHQPHGRGAAGRPAVARRARHRRRFPGVVQRRRDADRRVLRADPRRAGKVAAARARDRRAGPLHRGAGRDRRVFGDGQGQARRALVVLPGRRPVRLVQRSDVRPRQVPGDGAARRWRAASRACSPARPATPST